MIFWWFLLQLLHGIRASNSLPGVESLKMTWLGDFHFSHSFTFSHELCDLHHPRRLEETGQAPAGWSFDKAVTIVTPQDVPHETCVDIGAGWLVARRAWLDHGKTRSIASRQLVLEDLVVRLVRVRVLYWRIDFKVCELHTGLILTRGKTSAPLVTVQSPLNEHVSLSAFAHPLHFEDPNFANVVQTLCDMWFAWVMACIPQLWASKLYHNVFLLLLFTFTIS